MFKGNGTPSASPLGGLKRIFKKDVPVPVPPLSPPVYSSPSQHAARPLGRRAGSSGAPAPPSEDELHSLFSEARRLLAEVSSSETESPAAQQAIVSELKAAIRRVQAALDRVTNSDEQFVWQQHLEALKEDAVDTLATMFSRLQFSSPGPPLPAPSAAPAANTPRRPSPSVAQVRFSGAATVAAPVSTAPTPVAPVTASPGSMFDGMVLSPGLAPPATGPLSPATPAAPATALSPNAGAGASLFDGLALVAGSAAAPVPQLVPVAATPSPAPLFEGLSIVSTGPSTPPPAAAIVALDAAPVLQPEALALTSGPPPSPPTLPPPPSPPPPPPPAASPDALFAGLQLVTPVPSPAQQISVHSFPEAPHSELPLFGRQPSGLDASELEADAEELDAPREEATVQTSAVVEEVQAVAHLHEPVSAEEASEQWVAAVVPSTADSGMVDEEALIAAATSAGDTSVVQLAEALSRAAAVERAALAGRRAATTALTEARLQLSRAQEQQQRRSDAEDFEAADAMNATIAESEAVVAAAESVLSAAEHDVAAASLAVLAASAAELAAWDEAVLRLTGPQARARKREALEAERTRASARKAAACAKTQTLAAERDALAAALAAAERQLAAAQLEEAAATDALGSLEVALAAVEQGPSSDSALVPPDVAARMQAAVDGRRHAHATRENAVTVLRALAVEEETAATALATAKQREATHARDVAQALATHASAQQVVKSARENVARLAAEVERASGLRAIAVASKNFKAAAELTSTIRDLNAEREAAEESLQSLSARGLETEERLRALQAQISARAADIQACARGLALARWRRLREEAQFGLRPDEELRSLRADAAALAAEHGFLDADA